MAENSFFWTTDGATPEGHQLASYTQANWSTSAEIMAACSGFEGVAPGYKNELAVTYISANHCHVDTGGAVVDGKVYINDTSGLGVTIDSATAGHYRIDRIVALCDWAAYTVTIAVKKNTVEDAAAPALTLTEDWTVSGTHYAILLYQASVTDAGVVTLTDERKWASHPAIRRQGGSATHWETAGTTNYSTGGSIIQVGSAEWTGGAASTGSFSITFPTPFSYYPLTFITPNTPTDHHLSYSSSGGTTGITVNWVDNAGANHTSIFFNWLAIGPK